MRRLWGLGYHVTQQSECKLLPTNTPLAPQKPPVSQKKVKIGQNRPSKAPKWRLTIVSPFCPRPYYRSFLGPFLRQNELVDRRWISPNPLLLARPPKLRFLRLMLGQPKSDPQIWSLLARRSNTQRIEGFWDFWHQKSYLLGHEIFKFQEFDLHFWSESTFPRLDYLRPCATTKIRYFQDFKKIADLSRPKMAKILNFRSLIR